MSTLTYNSVTLTNCETKRFDVTNQFEDSDTDVQFRRFVIEVVGYCSTIVNSKTVNISTNNVNVVTGYNNTRAALMEKGKPFVFVVNDSVLLQAAAPGQSDISDTTDVNNGPKPRYCTISKISPAVFKVLFGIEVCLIGAQTNTNQQGVLSNRWATTEDVDEHQFITRTLSGRLRIGNQNLDVHSFRGWGIPSLQPNMRRMGIHVNSSLDGLTLDYTIVDKQQFAAPPAPAVDWGCTHGITTGDGVTCFGEVSCWLQGGPATAKTDLIATAASVCMRKLDLFGQNLANPQNAKQQGFWINQAAIIDTVDQNRIEMTLRVQYSGADRLAFMASPNSPSLGKPLDQISQPLPGYNPGAFPVTKNFGNLTPAGRFVCFLQTPADDNHKYPYTGKDTTSGAYAGPDNGSGTVIETTEGDFASNPQSGDNYTPSHIEVPYTYYRIKSKYHLDENKVQLPSGASNGIETSKVVQLFRPTARRTIWIYAERSGAWPQIPAPKNVGSDIFLGWSPELRAPQLGADAETLLFGVEAEYRYAVTTPPAIGEIRSGHAPMFSDDLIDPMFFLSQDAVSESIA